MSDATENWKDVPGFEGRYRVSDLGRVYSLVSGRTLKPYPNAVGGYLMVSLYSNKKRHPRTVHSLVLETFVGPRPEKAECLHGVTGNQDNRLSNLRWGTRSENIADQRSAGTLSRGDKHRWSRLTEADIPRIRADKRDLKSIAADYNVHFATISCVRLRKSWVHV